MHANGLKHVLPEKRLFMIVAFVVWNMPSDDRLKWTSSISNSDMSEIPFCSQPIKVIPLM